MFYSVVAYPMRNRLLQGDLLLKYCAYEDALAIKTVAWSPNSMFLCVTSPTSPRQTAADVVSQGCGQL